MFKFDKQKKYPFFQLIISSAKPGSRRNNYPGQRLPVSPNDPGVEQGIWFPYLFHLYP